MGRPSHTDADSQTRSGASSASLLSASTQDPVGNKGLVNQRTELRVVISHHSWEGMAYAESKKVEYQSDIL